MNTYKTLSIRPFIGAKDYDQSQQFYKALGFTELSLGPDLSYFTITPLIGFYLQRAYVKEWVDNSMLFLEVDDLDDFRSELLTKGLTQDYPLVRISDIKSERWGEVFFVHDPSGILWQIGTFKSA